MRESFTVWCSIFVIRYSLYSKHFRHDSLVRDAMWNNIYSMFNVHCSLWDYLYESYLKFIWSTGLHCVIIACAIFQYAITLPSPRIQERYAPSTEQEQNSIRKIHSSRRHSATIFLIFLICLIFFSHFYPEHWTLNISFAPLFIFHSRTSSQVV